MPKEFVRELTNLARRHRLDYITFIQDCAIARTNLGLTRPSRSRRLPHLLTDLELKKFYQVIDESEKLSHQIMLRLLFFTAIRVSELVMIKLEDVDLGNCKIYIELGKGDKDRYILFPESFKLPLQAHLSIAHAGGYRYLFESNQRKAYSTRMVQKIVGEYAEKAGVRVHPHLLRHQMLTWLTRQGLNDAQIQLISGHASKKSLEVYQHMGLESVEKDYQDAVRKIEM